ISLRAFCREVEDKQIPQRAQDRPVLVRSFSKFALHAVRMAERAKTLHRTNVVVSHLQHFHHFPDCSFGSWHSRFQSLGGVGSNPTAAIITSWLCSPLSLSHRRFRRIRYSW